MLPLHNLLAPVLLACATAGVFAAAPSYDTVIISPPAPYNWIQGTKVNNHGDFAAVATGDDGVNAYLVYYVDVGFVSLPVPRGGHVTGLSGINDSQQVTGTSTEGAFVWAPSEGWTTISPPGGFEAVVPAAINRHGVVVGSITQVGSLLKQSFYWTKSGGTRIVANANPSWLVGVNNRGDFAGTVVLDNPFRTGSEAVYATGQSSRTLLGNAQDPKGTGSSAIDLNDYGAVAAACTTFGSGGATQACWWTKNSGMRLLGRPNTEAYAISNKGDIVGFDRGLNFGGFVWGADYGFVSIVDALSPTSPVLSEAYALDISEKGVATGYGASEGISGALVLRPVMQR